MIPQRGKSVSADRNQNVYAKVLAKRYLHQISNGKKAFEAHRGPKSLVRYEDLKSDTLGTLQRLCSELELLTDDERLARTAKGGSWENVPQSEKGEGKFYRKGTPGGWKEDLNAKQVENIERVTAPLLAQFYPNSYEDLENPSNV